MTDEIHFMTDPTSGKLWVRRLREIASSQNQELTGAIRALNENKVGHNLRISYNFRA